MRLHIVVDDAVVREIDQRSGPRGRSRYIVAALQRALDADRRWDGIEQSLGSSEGSGHDWDEDPAEWVRSQRFADDQRVG